MSGWLARLAEDPLPWLLEEDSPAVRHLALRRLVGKGVDDPEVAAARDAAMRTNPIAAILDAQSPEGWWAGPGYGYLPKYTSTVWSLMFLDQLGADGRDPRVRLGCEYLLEHAQASNGGFSALRSGEKVAPSGAIHCLNGNLLRALIGFGWLDDERVARSIAWQAAAITGEGMQRWYATVPGPGFRCSANNGHDCAWGAIKTVLGLARVPADRRSPIVDRAIETGVEFLLSRDPAVADYPTANPGQPASQSWFKLGFPSAYVTDVLQNLEALVDAGAGADRRIDGALEWLAGQQHGGRWLNRYDYHGKMWRDIDRGNGPSKWVTLRAYRVLKAVDEARA